MERHGGARRYPVPPYGYRLRLRLRFTWGSPRPVAMVGGGSSGHWARRERERLVRLGFLRCPETVVAVLVVRGSRRQRPPLWSLL